MAFHLLFLYSTMSRNVAILTTCKTLRNDIESGGTSHENQTASRQLARGVVSQLSFGALVNAWKNRGPDQYPHFYTSHKYGREYWRERCITFLNAWRRVPQGHRHLMLRDISTRKQSPGRSLWATIITQIFTKEAVHGSPDIRKHNDVQRGALNKF